MSLPSDDFSRKIFFEIHNDLLRQSPGSIQSKSRSFRSVDSSEKKFSILDIGCGEGGTTIELAKLGHHVTAIDNNQSFIKILLTRIKEERLEDHIIASLGDMFCLKKFVNGNIFDVILSQGSIYIIGFEPGLNEWNKFFNNDGYFISLEFSWLTKNPPLQLREFWSKNYPGINSRQQHFHTRTISGYQL